MYDQEYFFIEKENFKPIVGELLRDIRINKKHMTQETLGDLTGFDRTYIGAIERGEKNVSFFAMYKIFKVLEIDPTSFFNQI